MRGVFEIVGAFTSSADMSRWLLVVGGGLSVVLGILFVANPGKGAVSIAFVLGLMALLWGIAFVVLSLMLRSQASHLEGPATTPPATA